MFFKKSHSAQEIEVSVMESLPPPQSEEEGIQVALQSLADSAEIFEAMNLPDEAEVITQFMETIASGQFAMVKEAKKKAKKKTKSKTKSKSKNKAKAPKSKLVEVIEGLVTDAPTAGLDSDKEVENLENIGWVFNAPKSDCGECSMADDGEYEDEDEDYFTNQVVDRVKRENNGKSPEDKPLDFEKCDECGYDHVYEHEKAGQAHFPTEVDDDY